VPKKQYHVKKRVSEFGRIGISEFPGSILVEYQAMDKLITLFFDSIFFFRIENKWL
jgi:hypothetical protein